VKGGETLLQLVSELKLPAIVGNGDRGDAQAVAKAAEFHRQIATVDGALAVLSAELASGIAALEFHYYSSLGREVVAGLPVERYIAVGLTIRDSLFDSYSI
jgi:hypothetical protein